MAEDRAALFVFAHQDDEMAAAFHIVREVKRGRAVHCVFLTDGRTVRASAEVRNRESLDVLARLGVAPDHVHFPGTEIPIPDGTLVEHLEAALDALLRSVTDADTVYCLAWEGGHQDHDASHLVAAALAARRGISDRCFEIPMYRRLIGPFFRVFSPLGEGWEWSGATFREGLVLSLLPWRFRSQRRSWLGLFPQAFVKLAILRRYAIRRVDWHRFHSRPHDGQLFYERRFRFPYERFQQAAEPFLRKHFGAST